MSLFERGLRPVWLIVVCGIALTVPASARPQDEPQQPSGAGPQETERTNVIFVPPGYSVLLTGNTVVLFPSYTYWWYAPVTAFGYWGVPYVANPAFYPVAQPILFLGYRSSYVRFEMALTPLLWQRGAPVGGVTQPPLNVTRRDLYVPESEGVPIERLVSGLTWRPWPLDRPWGQ